MPVITSTPIETNVPVTTSTPIETNMPVTTSTPIETNVPVTPDTPSGIVPVTNITLNKEALLLKKGDSEVLTVSFFPHDTTDQNLIWTSSDTNVVTVSDGKIVAAGQGTAIITVSTDNKKSATCVVTVESAVVGVSLNQINIVLEKGDTITLLAHVDGDPSAPVLWTSTNTSVATVSSSGKVTAISAGNTVITALAKGTIYYANCYVVVNDRLDSGTEDTHSEWQKDNKLKHLPEPDFGTCTGIVSGGATFVDVTKDDVMRYIDGLKSIGYYFSATANTSQVYAGSGSNGTYTVNIGWTLYGNNFSVLVQGGSAEGGDVDNNEGDDEIIYATRVWLDKQHINLTLNNSDILVATLEPNATVDKTLYWSSSNTSVATVVNGIVTAVGKGTAVITVKTSNGLTDLCTVTVESPVRQIVLNHSEANLNEGDSLILSVTITPIDADDVELVWTSSQESIVTVENGVVKAVGKGTAIVTVCTSNGIRAECLVVVTVKATSISLNTTTKNMIVGDVSLLEATVFPKDAGDKTVVWQSSDSSVVSVDSNGRLSAISCGTATITATTNNFLVASCVVTVADIAVNLDKNALQMIVGEKNTLIATILPSAAMNRTIVWECSDSSVLTVDNGVLSALKPGVVTVTARSLAGGSVSSCTVTVTAYSLSFATLEKHTNELYGRVGNSTTSFSFKDEVFLTGNASFVVSLDEYGEQSVVTKTVSLREGNNTFYIHIVSEDDVTTYTVFIRRAPMYKVMFQLNNGQADMVVDVEEGDCISAPNLTNPDETRYTFISWDYDFQLPITQSITISAIWEDCLGDFEFYMLDGQYVISGVKDVSRSEYSIPNMVGVIGEDAFYGCVNLKKITIPDSVKVIEASAFEGCEKLVSVVIPDSVLQIGKRAFYGCKSLVSVTLGTGVLEIGSSAFYTCNRLVEVVNQSTLELSKGNSKNGYLAYYAVDIHKGESKIVDKEGYLFYIGEQKHYLLGYIGEEVNLVLPQISENKSYDIYKYAFDSNDRITSVIIQSNVNAIGYRSFARCSNLVSVTVGKDVSDISSEAFYACYKLIEIINHSNLVMNAGSSELGGIAEYAKSAHTGQSKVVAQDGYLFYSWSGENYLLGYIGTDTTLVLPTSFNGQPYEIYGWAFYGCVNLESVIILENVTGIGMYSFNSCANLQNIVLADSILSIGLLAFNGTKYYSTASNWENDALYIGKHLVSVKKTVSDVYSVIEGTKTIAQAVFQNCEDLTGIIIPESVVSLGTVPFIGCTYLSSIVVSEKNTVYCSKGNCLIELATGTLVAGCKKSIIPSDGSVTMIGDRAFEDCYKLTTITIPKCITMIGKSAFEGCYGLEQIVIPEGVTMIGKRAFYWCEGLKSVALPNSIAYIGEDAFHLCKKLNKIIYCGNEHDLQKVEKTENWNYDRDVQFHKYTDDICSFCGKAWSEEEDGEFLEPSLEFTLRNNEYWVIGWVGDIEEIIIPNQYNGIAVTGIGENAFSGCDTLTSVVISDGIVKIGYNAFLNCSNLVSVTIGSDVSYIEQNAFSGCVCLTNVYFNAESMNDLQADNGVFYRAGYEGLGITVFVGDNVTKIHAFLFCPKLESSLFVPNIVSVIFSSKSQCKNIGKYAFLNCYNLESVVIPSSVTEIGKVAFYNCDALSVIYFGGTAAAWEKLDTTESVGTNKMCYYYSTDAPMNTTYSYWHYVDGVPTKW